MRPPQKVSRPVMSTRRPTRSAEPDAAAVAQHVVDGLLHLALIFSASSMIRLFEYRSWPLGMSNLTGSRTRSLNFEGK